MFEVTEKYLQGMMREKKYRQEKKTSDSHLHGVFDPVTFYSLTKKCELFKNTFFSQRTDCTLRNRDSTVPGSLKDWSPSVSQCVAYLV